MSEFLYNELFAIACGKKLGQGFARSVYVLSANDDYVIKVETRAQSFQNVSEWETWSWVKEHPALAKWFAPCTDISPSGAFLVKRRVTPLRPRERPKKLPAFLCDLKIENFGLYKGRVVCCDYGTVHSAIRDVPRKLVEATWRT